jgi:hypothetical protein
MSRIPGYTVTLNKVKGLGVDPSELGNLHRIPVVIQLPALPKGCQGDKPVNFKKFI